LCRQSAEHLIYGSAGNLRTNQKEVKMRKTILLTSLATATLLLIGCGGDKKVEERVAEIQKSDVQQSATEATKPVAPVAKEEPKQASSQGQSLYVKKCAACHGEKAEGKASYPKLAGQTKEDLTKKLDGYIDGSFGGAQKVIMAGQAKQLAQSEREAIAEYISTIK
jgi:cytochrome c